MRHEPPFHPVLPGARQGTGRARKLWVLLAMCFIGACGGGGGSSTPSGPPTLSIAPSSITVAAGGTQPFTATSSSGSTGTVTWEVNGTTGGNSTVGTISSSGMYTAPTQVPSPQPIIVTALSNGLTTTASLTVAYSQASLQGSYMAGFTELAGSQATSLIGYFDFDGQGDVGGTVDVNSATAGVLTGVAVTGHDTINPDGSGTLSLDAGAAGSFNLDVTLAASGIFALTDATGGKIVATLWVPQAAVQGVTSLTPGTYILSYGGSAPNRQGVGAVTVTAGNQVTVQELDQHSSGNGVATLETNLPGSYTLSANGRGTFSFTDAQGTHHFVMYAMPGGDFQTMSLDAGTPLTGSLDLQTATTLPTSGVAVVTAENFDAGNDPDMLLAQTDLANMTYLGSQNDNGLVTGISGTGTVVQSADSYGRGQLTIPTASGPRTLCLLCGNFHADRSAGGRPARKPGRRARTCRPIRSGRWGELCARGRVLCGELPDPRHAGRGAGHRQPFPDQWYGNLEQWWRGIYGEFLRQSKLRE